MSSFLYNLKGQATVLNGLITILILAFVLYRYKRRKIAKLLVGVTILIFLLCSTYWLPNYLANKLESKYSPLTLPNNSIDTGKVLIHVLGSGYILDKRLPANAQLGLVALGRLAEGIRIHRLIKNSVIICSGYSSLGLETQAQVTKRAAIVLGVDADKLETLDKPSTTREEAMELGRRYNKTAKLVIVTDAMHMNRAMRLFSAEGFNPLPAPTNYRVNEGPDQGGMKWWPSVGNIGLMNYVIHEWLGDLKASINP
jgi:uncharacterized SAM-binding protein YcdF (DUF218 family)